MQYQGTRPDYIVSGGGAAAAMMYGGPPRPGDAMTHVRTISGNKDIEDYDYPLSFDMERPRPRGRRQPNRFPPPRPMRFRRDRRFRNPPDYYYDMGPVRRFPPRVMNNEIYDDVDMSYRYRRPPRISYRNGNGNSDDYFADEPVGRRRGPSQSGRYAVQQPPPKDPQRRAPRRRRSTAQRASQSAETNAVAGPARSDSERPSAQQTEGPRRPRRSRVRRRRTTEAGAAGAPKPAEDTPGGRARKSTNGTANKRFGCSMCRQTFRTESLRIRHVRLMHQRRRRRDFVCKECRGVFPNARSITVHQSQPHGAQNPAPAEGGRRGAPLGTSIRYLPESMPIFSCKFCPFGFLSAADAESHQTRCRASQPMTVSFKLEYPGNDQFILPCICCPELLSIRQNMAEHFKVLHPLVKFSLTYYCALCSKEFDSESKASQHLECDHVEDGKAKVEELIKTRKHDFIAESLRSYEVKRPVSLARVMSDVRQVMGRMLRQVSRGNRPANEGNQARRANAGVSARPSQPQ